MNIMTDDQVKVALKKLLYEKNKPNPEQLFSIPQVAKKLGKEYKTIRRMINQGRLQSTTDKKFVSQQAIDNYLTGKSS